MTPLDLVQALIVVVLWGVNFAAVKIALTVFPPLLLCGLRFLLLGLLLAPLFRPQRAQLGGILAMAVVLGVGHFGLLFFGLSGMDAATAAIVTQLGVPFSVLLAWAAFGEHLGVARAVGLVCAFAGVGLLAGEPHLPNLLPLGMAVLAMAAWAVSNVQVKSLGAIRPLALNGWTALLAAPMLLTLSALFESGQMTALQSVPDHLQVVAALGYTVFASSLVAYSLWYRLLSRHPMNRVVPITLLGPVVGIATGVLVLGESLTWQKLVGGLITISGVAMIQVFGSKTQRVT